MYYVAFDTLFSEDSGLLFRNRQNILDATNEQNYFEGYCRFLPLAIDSHNRRNPYRRNPDQIPIPLKMVTPVWNDWKERALRLLNVFKRDIAWGTGVSAGPNLMGHHGFRLLYNKSTIEFETPQSTLGGYTYRLTLAKDDPGYSGLVEKDGRYYYGYKITESYLADENREILDAVFRILFMGDQFLLPFLSKKRKILTTPQQSAFDGFMESYAREDRKGAVVLPTGVGKTVVVAKIVSELRPKRLLYVSHRNFILDQAIEAIEFDSKEPGKIAITKSHMGRFYGSYGWDPAGEKKKEELTRKYVFANPQSFNAIKNKWPDPKTFDLIIVDEFHHGNAKTWKKIIEHFDPRFLLGLTATPYRPDAKPLDLVENNVLYKASEWEVDEWLARAREGAEDIPSLSLVNALRLGYLVRPKIKKLLEPEYRTVANKTLSKKEAHKIGEVRDKKIVDRFLGRGDNPSDVGNRKAIIFCGSVEEAQRLEKLFTAAKIKSDHLLYQRHELLNVDKAKCKKCKTPSECKCSSTCCRGSERARKLKAFKEGDTQALFVRDILNEGVDITSIEVILWIKKTKSIVQLLQQLGRGLRLDVGKRKLLVLDFMDNIARIKRHIKNGYDMPSGTPRNIRRKKKKELKREEELLEFLESSGSIVQDGEDVYLISMTPSVENSEEELPAYPVAYSATASSHKSEKKIPKLTGAQKDAIAKAHESLDKIKDNILKFWKKTEKFPGEERIMHPIATKSGIDYCNMLDFLYEKGLITRPIPLLRPTNIEATLATGSLDYFGNQANDPARIRKIIEIGSSSLGSRLKSSEMMGGGGAPEGYCYNRKVCRIAGCDEEGIHRGMCQTHYAFTYREIYGGRASEDDLVTRFLLEPKDPIVPITAQPVPSAPVAKRAAKKKRGITKKATKKAPKKKRPTRKHKYRR